MKENLRKNIVPIVVLLIIALLSLFVISGFASSPDFHRGTLNALNDKETAVLTMSGASVAASAGISLLPGDVGTSIADKLADLTSNFLLILCVIILEKYLLTITGTVTFSVLIPLACFLGIAYHLFERERLKKLAIKLTVFGLLLFALVPASVQISALIESTYQTSLEESESITEKIKALTESLESESETNAEDEGLIGVVSNVAEGVSTASIAVIDWAREQVNHFIEYIAVMIVTNCVIPVLVLVVFVWLAKILLSVEIPLSYRKARKGLKNAVSPKKEEM